MVAHSVALPTLVAPGMPTEIWSVAEAGDLDLGDTEAVTAGTDDVDRAVHRFGGDFLDLRRRAALKGQLDAALKVESELRRLVDRR